MYLIMYLNYLDVIMEKESTKKEIKLSQVRKSLKHEVTLKAWVETKRELGGIIFLVLRDITDKLQAVVTEDSKAFKKASSLPLESVIKATGTIKEQKQAPGGIELEIEELEILSEAEAELPIPVDEKSGEKTKRSKRMDYRWLDLRKPRKALIFKSWTAMEQGFRMACLEQDFIQIHSPKLMASPSESRSELFELEYFGEKAYLAQSPQFYKQMAQAAGFEGVFEVGPVFRANPSFTPRHDTEFTSYDVELSFVESHHDVMDVEEKIIVKMLKEVKQSYGDDIKHFYGEEVVIPETPFPRLTMEEAKELLKQAGVESKDVSDFSPEEERQLSRLVKQKYGHEFVFVTDYLVEARPFYHMRYEDKPKVTKSFDLLWRGVEITTGAQREHRIGILTKQAIEKGLDISELEHYFEFFRYGMPPHGGFAIGPTRMLTRLLGISNVREVTYLYRGPKRLTP
jgi:aspartyl-tRNA synthetase